MDRNSYLLITGIIAVVGLHTTGRPRIVRRLIGESTLSNCLHKVSASPTASHLLTPLTAVRQRRERGRSRAIRVRERIGSHGILLPKDPSLGLASLGSTPRSFLHTCINHGLVVGQARQPSGDIEPVLGRQRPSEITSLAATV